MAITSHWKVELTSPQPLAVPTLWVDAFWDGPPPPPGTRIRLALVSADDREWLVRSHPLVRDEEAAWSTG
ncbi:MAG: hypothetical protein R3C44_11490 [Chloroflexota bacterium]